MTQAQNTSLAQPVRTGVATAVPKLWTTFWITLFFGLFGLIPTIIHSNRARALGVSGANYWATFGCTLTASYLIAFLISQTY